EEPKSPTQHAERRSGHDASTSRYVSALRTCRVAAREIAPGRPLRYIAPATSFRRRFVATTLRRLDRGARVGNVDRRRRTRIGRPPDARRPLRRLRQRITRRQARQARLADKHHILRGAVHPVIQHAGNGDFYSTHVSLLIVSVSSLVGTGQRSL